MHLTNQHYDFKIEEHSFFSKKYKIIRQIGETKILNIMYKVINLENNKEQFISIKFIRKKTTKCRILEETRCLSEMDGEHNIILVHEVNAYNNPAILIFPYVENVYYKDFIRNRTFLQIKQYMFSLLEALNHLHVHKYVHRNIKPSNFLWDPIKEKGVLVGFGLVQECNEEDFFYSESDEKISCCDKTHLNNQNNTYFVNDGMEMYSTIARIKTKGFRAPEVLFNSKILTSAMDIWSAGVIFIVLLTKNYSLFTEEYDSDVLDSMEVIFGTEEFKKAAKIYEKVYEPDNSDFHDKLGLEVLLSSMNGTEFDEISLDLLNKMLKLTAK